MTSFLSWLLLTAAVMFFATSMVKADTMPEITFIDGEGRVDVIWVNQSTMETLNRETFIHNMDGDKQIVLDLYRTPNVMSDSRDVLTVTHIPDGWVLLDNNGIGEFRLGEKDHLELSIIEYQGF